MDTKPAAVVEGEEKREETKKDQSGTETLLVELGQATTTTQGWGGSFPDGGVGRQS